MIAVTDADRKAAKELRDILADVSGFWHRQDDDGPLCVAMAKHREQCELELLQKMSSAPVRSPVPDGPCAVPAIKPRMNLPASAMAG